MTTTKAIKTFFEEEPHGAKVGAQEMLELKKSLSDEEYREFGRLCCEALGVEHDA